MIALFLPVAVLLAASLITISSISFNLFLFQLLWIFLGAAIVLLFIFIDWRFILNYRWLIGGLYLLAVILLLLAYLEGPLVRNTRSWVAFGPLRFQPIELMKVVLILVYANYFSRRHLSIARWKNISASFIFFAVPAFLTALQPDLGSALVLFGIWFCFLLLSGLPPRRVLAALAVFLLAGFFIWTYGLKGYQRERVTGVFYPERSVLGINYSVTQSKIAIGSAGFWGKGYAQGAQTQLGFLPEAATDFPLAALIEEWGVLGGVAVIGAFLYLIFQILQIGGHAQKNFEKFVCLGGVVIFGLQFLLNAGSELGLTPVIGITFPFLSYGGSSLTANFFILSLINAIRRQK